MRSCLFLVGLSLSALSCAYGADGADLQNSVPSETSSSSHALPLKADTEGPLLIITAPLKDSKDSKDSERNFLTKYGEGLFVKYGSKGSGGNFFCGEVKNFVLECVKDGSPAPYWLKNANLAEGTYAWQLWVTKKYQGTEIATYKPNKGWIAQGHIVKDGFSQSLQITPGEKNK